MEEKNYGFLFDLDGVLIDSEKEYSRIWATVNSEFPTGVQDLEVRIKGCTLDKILDDYFPVRSIREKVVKRLYELEGKMHYAYLPGAEALLNRLRELEIPASLVTSSNEDKMRHLDEELPEIKSYFNFIVTADIITKSKPDPEGYLTGAKKINREIKDCVVFEDSLQGVKAGNASGASVIGIAGTLPKETLSPYCDIVINSLEEITVEEIIKLIDGKQ